MHVVKNLFCIFFIDWIITEHDQRELSGFSRRRKISFGFIKFTYATIQSRHHFFILQSNLDTISGFYALFYVTRKMTVSCIDLFVFQIKNKLGLRFKSIHVFMIHSFLFLPNFKLLYENILKSY